MNNKTTKIIFLTILFFGIFGMSETLQAATYYVDYVGGSATAAGTATGTAWQYSPGDTRFAAACTGDCATTWTGAGSRLNPGDKVIFKGGVTYTGSLITISWAGNADTTAGRIIFDGDSGTYVSRWGSGTEKAIIDGATTIGGFFVSGSKSYVTINSFEVKNGPTPRGSYLIGTGGVTHYLTVSNNTVHDVGNNAFTGGTYGGGCIGAENSDYVRFQNNLAYNCAYPIFFVANDANGNSLEISGNTVTDWAAWGITVAMAGSANLTNWNIFNNTVHDLVYFDRTSDPHNNYIWIYGNDENYGVTGINIYNNLLYMVFIFIIILYMGPLGMGALLFTEATPAHMRMLVFKIIYFLFGGQEHQRLRWTRLLLPG